MCRDLGLVGAAVYADVRFGRREGYDIEPPPCFAAAILITPLANLPVDAQSASTRLLQLHIWQICQ